MNSTLPNRALFATILLAATLGFACGDDDPDPKNNVNNMNTQNNVNNTSAPFVATTYNVGLARGFVDFATERMEPVADAIAEHEADVLCLQEVWLVQDDTVQGQWSDVQIQTLVDGASESYPHSFFEITQAEGAVGCTEDEAAPLAACVNANCDGVSNDMLLGCVTTNCFSEFGEVSQDCSQCLAGELGGSFEEIQDACVGNESSGVAYDGHNGLLLLSKHPLSNTTHTAFDAVQTARSLLQADVEHPELGVVNVGCTHLTADLSGISTFPDSLSPYESYEEEQAAQIEASITLMKEASTPALFLGDFNTGPSVDGLDSELPDNYALFEAEEWSNPYLELDGRCTFCSSNRLINGERNKAIDHVFVIGDEFEATTATRTFDETVDIDGMPLHLSDHFGVTVTFELRAE